MPDITEPMGPSDSQHPDTRRFASLFDAHRRSVLGYALRRLDDREAAADALAETFLIAWRKLDEVPDGEAARPWLLGVARRVLANQRRGVRRHAALTERLQRELATQLKSARDPSTNDLLVHRALAALSEDDREVVLLAGWEGLSPAEIGIAVGVSGVTARSRLHRARRRLRTELEALGWDSTTDAPTNSTTTFDLAREQTR